MSLAYPYFANGFAVGGMMEYVERFRAGSKDIHSCDIGKYVRFSDYQRVAFKFKEYFEAWKDLRRRNAELEAENERLRDALKRYVAKFGNCGDVYDDAKAALKEEPNGKATP